MGFDYDPETKQWSLYWKPYSLPRLKKSMSDAQQFFFLACGM